MAPGDTQRIFEKLEALGNQNAVLVERMEAMKENYIELKQIMQGIKKDGCSLGAHNKEQIKQLAEASKEANSIKVGNFTVTGGVAVALVCAVYAVLKLEGII